jgi:DNA-binding NarL/FixJ family response regulator
MTGHPARSAARRGARVRGISQFPVPGDARSYDGPMGMRVVLAEDSVLLRQGLVALLTEHPEVDEVIEAGDLDELVAAVERHDPDAVLADIRMPPTHTDEGIRAAERFRRTHPGLGVVVLSQHADAEGALALVAGGSTGRGYLLKERVSDVDQLVDALQAVTRRESVIDPHVVDALMRHRMRFDASPVARLTAREREVLGLIATGAANAAIAERLHVTSRAVEKHINSIFSKLDLPGGDQTHRRVAAVLLYLGETGGSTPAGAGA